MRWLLATTTAITITLASIYNIQAVLASRTLKLHVVKKLAVPFLEKVCKQQFVG